MKTNLLVRLLRRTITYATLAIAGLTISLTPPAQAGSIGVPNAVPANNLIRNSLFNSLNGRNPWQVTTDVAGGPVFSGSDLGPWTVTSGLVLLFGPAPGVSGTNADILNGAPNFFNPHPTASAPGFRLWGPANHSPDNGLRLGPNGGNFVALDGELLEPGNIHVRGEISQTINGLTVGEPTTVSFNWAAAQQEGFRFATTEQIRVGLCPVTGACPSQDLMFTNVLSNADRGFNGWEHASFTFTPTMSTEVLSFLSIGTPAQGEQPPFALIDGGVTLEQHVPEPGTWSLLGIGFAAFAVACRRPRWFGVTA